MDRYLARELTEPESDWWEAYILAHPHLAAELEADEAVRAHTAAAGAALTAADPAESPASSTADHGRDKDSRTGTRPPGLRGRYSWQQYAATALILILSAAALPQYLRKPPPDVMPVDVYTLNTERSGGAPEWIVENNGGAESEWVVVNIPNNQHGITRLSTRDGTTIPMRLNGPFSAILIDRSTALRGLIAQNENGQSIELSVPTTTPPLRIQK